MTREIPLSQGKVALVDDGDYDWLSQWKWYYHRHRYTGYAERKASEQERKEGERGIILMHRAILKAPPGSLVDHINGDGLDNRPSNLRLCNHKQNSRHRRPPKDRYKGVCRYRGKWRAMIKVSGKNLWLGSFDTPEEAAHAYNRAAKEHHGQFAWANAI